MRMKLFVILTLFISATGFSQASKHLNSIAPKFAPIEVAHRNKIDDMGRKQGKWQSYSRNGKLILEITYKNNQKHGEYARFNGVTGKMIEKGNYLKGVKNGSYTKWFSTGSKRVEGSYSNGKKSGMWNYYYKSVSGALRMAGNFELGKREGAWIFYDKTGAIRKKVKFQSGKLVRERKDSLKMVKPNHQ